MPVLLVYSRQGCHLCEQLLEELLPLVNGCLTVQVRDIDSQPDWRTHYDSRVPVVTYRGRVVCEGHLDTAAVAAVLASLPPGP